jgi:hypothetical protein
MAIAKKNRASKQGFTLSTRPATFPRFAYDLVWLGGLTLLGSNE